MGSRTTQRISYDRATTAAPFTVVVCTRERHRKLHQTLDALECQQGIEFDVIVVDQSERTDASLQRRASANARLIVIRDSGRGLSRARNVGWRAAGSEWVAFLDDDVRPDADWASELRKAIIEHPEASFISGDVRPNAEQPPHSVLASVDTVTEERVIHGSRRMPFEIGMGICTVKRQTIMDLGGFDERLGAGAPSFPAADDTDFNYRFLRAGGIAYVTPRIRAVHEQWRSRREAISLYGGYSRAWAGFAMKHARTGDVAGGLRLWLMGLRLVAGMLRSAVRLSSTFRIAVAAAMLCGFSSGTVKGAMRRW